MPSNRELTDAARGLAEKLGLHVETAGLKNDALAQLVSDLQDQADARRFGAAAEAANGGDPDLPDTLPARLGAQRKAAPPPESQPLADDSEHEPEAPAEDQASGLPLWLPEPVNELSETLERLAIAASAPSSEPASDKEPAYAVAKGKAITSNRGILDAGTAVRVKDFLHGQETIDDLVSKGTLVKS